MIKGRTAKGVAFEQELVDLDARYIEKGVLVGGKSKGESHEVGPCLGCKLKSRGSIWLW